MSKEVLSMKCCTWLNKKTKNMKWYHFSFLKLSVFFATLFLVTAWTGFRNVVLDVAWYWYLLLMIVCMAPLLKKMFFSK